MGTLIGIIVGGVVFLLIIITIIIIFAVPSLRKKVLKKEEKTKKPKPVRQETTSESLGHIPPQKNTYNTTSVLDLGIRT